MSELVGVTWDHPRATTCLLSATAEHERRGGSLRVSWQARPLKDFEDVSIATLARRYDLLVIDHPLIGDAVHGGALLPFDEMLSPGALADSLSSVTPAIAASYQRGGRTWALPLDAAAQVSAWSPEGLQSLGAQVPTTWAEVVQLATEIPGSVAIAANPTHLWCSFLSLCHQAFGEPELLPDGSPAWWTAAGIDPEAAGHGLATLRELTALVVEDSSALDPIALLDQLANGGRTVYAPLVFGYVTYSRHPRAGARALTFGPAPGGDRTPTGTVMGGAGIAVSSHCAAPNEAAALAGYLTSGACQRGTYSTAGGQPAHMAAWEDDSVDAEARSFFGRTRPTVDRSFVRPTSPGFPQFQVAAAQRLHAGLRDGDGGATIIAELNELWRRLVLTQPDRARA